MRSVKVACVAQAGVTRVAPREAARALEAPAPAGSNLLERTAHIAVDGVWLELVCAECGQTLHGSRKIASLLRCDQCSRGTPKSTVTI